MSWPRSLLRPRNGSANCAVLPLRAGTSAAVAELSRAIGSLRLDGVVLPTEVAGRSLADPVFVPLLQTIARRRIPVLLHPGSLRPQDRPDQPGTPADTLEHAFASVRCAANLLYRGTFLRAPRLRLTLANGGGGLPFVAGRVALADQALRTELFVRPLRRLSFDTAQFADPGAVAALRTFVRTPQQVMYGSDWPLIDQPTPPATVAASFGDAAPWVIGAAAVAMFPTLQRR
jgi:6-methylsalicylate decarboxylase